MHSADYAVARCQSLFVCPSVTRRYYVETVKHVIKVFSPSGSQTILVFPYQTEWQYSDGDPSNGASNAKGVWKKLRFSTNISLYVGNNARKSHIYYGRQIKNRTQAFEWYQFEWPWVTSNPDFKVTLFFDAENLRNVTRHRHSFNGILIGTYTRPTQQCHFEWPWVTLSDLAKYSMTLSARRLSATAELLVTFNAEQTLCQK